MPPRPFSMNFREIDGAPINLDDYLSEQHAQEIIKLLEPNLIGDWRVRLTERWGQFIVRDDGWSEAFEIKVICRDTMLVLVRLTSDYNATATHPDLKYLPFEVPLEMPNLIEVLYSHVLSYLGSYKRCSIVHAINR